MREGLFWLDDLQWSSIKGCLPGRKRRGPQRVDDRRVISGIIHVLQSGMRWRDCPQEYGPATTIYNGTVTLPNRARNKSAGMLGSRRSDDVAPRLHRRGPEGSVRFCGGEMALDVESVVSGCVG